MPNKLKVFSALFIALITALLASPVFATLIRVPQDQPTIQAGINAAVNGDTVLVFSGVYHENLRFMGKSIRVISSKGRDSTVLISASGGSPIVLLDGPDEFSRFEGFTVESGGITLGVPAAILLQNSFGTVQNNVIQNISGVPAIRTQGESPKIISNVLRLNAGNRLIEFVSVNPLLQRNLIVENRNDLLVYVVDSFLAINNTIANNNGPYGVFFTGTNAVFEDTE